MIGLYDADLFFDNKVLPNLEVMKLAAYYTQKHREVCRLLTPLDKDLSAYDAIFCCSEKSNSIPKSFQETGKNITYVGPPLCGGEYIPFDNEEIDFWKPKLSIYKNFLRERRKITLPDDVIKGFLTKTYHRMYAGDKEIPPPQNSYAHKQFVIYDIDNTYKDWQRIISDVEKGEKKPASIVFRHPLKCKSEDDVQFVLHSAFIKKETLILLDFDANTIQDKKALIETNRPLFISIDTSNCYSANDEVEVMRKTLYKLYSFWAQGIPLKLYYGDEGVYNGDTYEVVFEALSRWTATSKHHLTFTKKKQSNGEENYKDKLQEIIWNYAGMGELFNHSFQGLKEGKRYG